MRWAGQESGRPSPSAEPAHAYMVLSPVHLACLNLRCGGVHEGVGWLCREAHHLSLSEIVVQIWKGVWASYQQPWLSKEADMCVTCLLGC